MSGCLVVVFVTEDYMCKEPRGTGKMAVYGGGGEFFLRKANMHLNKLPNWLTLLVSFLQTLPIHRTMVQFTSINSKQGDCKKRKKNLCRYMKVATMDGKDQGGSKGPVSMEMGCH